MSAYAHARTRFLEMLWKENMEEALSGGALLALSGGKDSVLLLSLFSEYAKEKKIPFAAFHLHHGIRGAEADRDKDFCHMLCLRLGVPFFSAFVSVPDIAKRTGEGLEAVARRERYRLLEETAKREGFTAVLTAHSATDNLETVLLHLLRGGGGNALCGIPPVRPLGDALFVLRPLLSLSSEEITAALKERELPFVFDSTNADTAYHRNYLRCEILPRLSPLSPCPERAVTRMTENLREDMALIDRMAKDAFAALFDGETLDAQGYDALPAPLRFRVLRLFHAAHAENAPLPEQVHLHAFFDRLSRTGDFSVSFPGGVRIARVGTRLVWGDPPAFTHPHTKLKMGINRLADGSLLWLLEESSKPLPQIVYSLSIRSSLASATIEGELYVRSRMEGDAYRFGGMTHKLKKMFSDRKIPTHLRSRVPVLCDGRGILWVPFFGVRDDGVKSKGAVTAVYLAAENVPTDFSDLFFDEDAPSS